MPRPTNKEELISAANGQFAKMWNLIDSMTPEQQAAEFAFEDRDRNLRDVLVHLYEWHRLLLNWVSSNKNCDPVCFLPSPYNWKTYPQMNIEFKNKHLTTTLQDAKSILRKSHAEVMEFIVSFTNEQLFTKTYYSWTGTTNLGSYFISSTSSHYDWAMKKIKQHIKSLK